MSWQTIVKDNNLQVANVSLKELNWETRLDAEYYRPEALFYLKSLEERKSVPISSVAKFVVGPFGSTVTVDKYVDDEDFSYVRNLDVKNFVINNPEAHIPKELFEKLSRFQIKEGDLLVTVVGTLGKVAIARAKDIKSIFSCKSTIVRCSEIDPYYLATYLNSKIGQTLLLRCKRGAIQEGLNLPDIKTLQVAIPSSSFQNKIREQVITAFSLDEKSIKKYQEAEQLLLREINLEEYKATGKNVSIRNLSDCVVSNRFDAEYWQIDFDSIQNTIRKNKGGFGTLEKLFDVSEKKVQIDPEKEYFYAELADVSSSTGTVDNFTLLKGKELPSRGRMALKNKDIIVSSVEGSLEKVALVSSDAKNLLGSTGFFVLRQKEYEPEVALILLKTKPIQALLKRQAQGTILTAIPKTSLARVLLPRLNEKTQKTIKNIISQSHQQMQEAKDLLETAKLAIKIFIEQDEKEALAYLNQ